jgi:hypothetical protein
MTEFDMCFDDRNEDMFESFVDELTAFEASFNTTFNMIKNQTLKTTRDRDLRSLEFLLHNMSDILHELILPVNLATGLFKDEFEYLKDYGYDSHVMLDTKNNWELKLKEMQAKLRELVIEYAPAGY